MSTENTNEKRTKDKGTCMGGGLHVLAFYETRRFWATEAWATLSARQAIGTASPYDDISVNPSTTT